MANEMSPALKYAELQETKQYIQLVRDILEEKYDSPPLACIHSYGCQQSVADGEKLKGLAASMGYGFTDNVDEADLILYNTCAVRENAEKRVFGNVGALKHHKRRKPDLIIGISGCMTEQQHVKDKLATSYKHVDLVMGTNAFSILPQRIYEKLTENKRYIEGEAVADKMPIIEGIPTRRDGKFKAWVPIMYGCDNFCSYCIVPYVRGRERSRESAAIIGEIESLVLEGYKDITLLGQNVNSYGKGLAERINFSELLRRINAIKGDFIIRFMTSHPKDCTHELIDTIAECKKVVRHLHLPVQSGSDRILSAMNRKYSVEQYLELIEYAKKIIPDISLTSDIIVGFPGETYEDFLQTLELVKKVRYTSLFTFIYSRRSGTAAVKLEDPISEVEKSKWFRELLKVQNQIGTEILQDYVGTTMRVLPEGIGKTGEGTLTSRDSGNLIVELDGNEDLIGKFVTVKIVSAMNWALKGELISE